jgi:hypothetical protein
MSDLKPIIVVRPRTLAPKATQKLEAAGYVVVEAADPAEVRALNVDVFPVAAHDTLTTALIDTFLNYPAVTGLHADFGKRFLAALKAARTLAEIEAPHDY